jgi:hypothetical protein
MSAAISCILADRGRMNRPVSGMYEGDAMSRDFFKRPTGDSRSVVGSIITDIQA